MKYLQLFLQALTLIAALFILHALNDQRQQTTRLQANLRTIQLAEQLHSVIERYRAMHDGELPEAEGFWAQVGWERHWDRRFDSPVFINAATGSNQEPKMYSRKLEAWLPNPPGAGSVSYQLLLAGGYRIDAYGTDWPNIIFSRVYP